nr:collagen alpha-1(III) chain-like isoform X1 [Nerophis lumbriciformis]
MNFTQCGTSSQTHQLPVPLYRVICFYFEMQAKIYFSFPGELLMRMLKMLILPLITSSLMSGLSSMESKACCRMGVLTVTYYLWTTFIAVVVGIVLVVLIKPGVGTEMESNRLGGGPVMTSADALLDLIRNMVPSNLIEATFQQVSARTRRPPPHDRRRRRLSHFLFVSSVQNGPGAHPEGPNQDHPAQLRVRGAGRARSQRSHGVPGADSAPRGHVQDESRQQPADERTRHCHLLRHHGAVAGQDGRARSAAGQRVPVHQRVRHEDNQRRRVVLPVRHHLPGGGQDPGHAGPEHAGEEAGLVRRHRARRPLRARPGAPPPLLLPAHQEEPLHVHPWAPAGPGHRPGNLLQLGDAAHHHEVSAGELPRGPPDRPLRAARGRHHQHGRHGALRGGGGHLHRPGQRLRAGLRTAGHHQHHRHRRQHRRSRHPPGRPGYHGDRADVRGPAPRRHHPHRGHRLDPGPISDHDQRAGRRPGGGHHRPPVSEGLPPQRDGKGRPFVRHAHAPQPQRGRAHDGDPHAQRRRRGVGRPRAHRLLQHLSGVRKCGAQKGGATFFGHHKDFDWRLTLDALSGLLHATACWRASSFLSCFTSRFLLATQAANSSTFVLLF